MKVITVLIISFLCLAGCAVQSSRGLDENYYSDMEYSNVDKKWYHKNPPPSARDMMSFPSSSDRD